MNPVFLIYFVLIVIALIILIAFVRCFFKRLKCMLSIRAMCRRNGFTLTVKHPLWFLGSRYARRCDCIIQTPGEVFGVKLFGCLWATKALILREYGEYIFRGHATFIKFIIDFIDSWPHMLPEYRFELRKSGLPAGTPVRRVLLINPRPLEIRMQPNNGQEEISGTGDMIRGMEIASLSHLIRIAESAK